jgi:hypothetical protein
VVTPPGMSMPQRLPHPRNMPFAEGARHEPSMVSQTIVISILSAARSEKSKTFARLFLHRFLVTAGW